MKGSISLATLALAAIALAPLALAQSAQKQQPKALTGTELVAWTQDQKAEPMPSTQTTPPPAQKPEQQAPSTPATAQQPAPAQQDDAHKTHDAHKTPAAQAFTGTVMKSGDTYVLKTADNMTYQLDDQTRAKDFEGKQVQVTGSLDSSNNTIKVQDIKQAS